MRARISIHGVVLLAASALLCACGVALGPGYRIERQQYDVHWTGTSELLVRSTYRVKNTGKTPIDYLEFELPEASHRSGLQVWLDGAAVATEAADESAPAGTVRVPVSPALALKKTQALVIEYRLRGPVSDGSATPSFFLETQGWYPELHKQEGLFGSGGNPPEKWDLRVTVPRDFLVHASGAHKGTKRRSDMVEHRFHQRPDSDSTPFVVAGRYHEQRARTAGSEVILWTFQPLQEAVAQAAGDWIGRTALEFEKAFGKVNEVAAVRIAESPPGMPFNTTEATFPGGVLVSSGKLGLADGERTQILRSLDEQLALSWFHHGITAASDSHLLFHNGLPPYAASIAAEARGNAASRDTLASSRLALYADMGGEEREPRFFLNDPNLTMQRIGYARGKAPLFFLALEDRYGKEVARKALARLLVSLRGRQFTTNDLRVAIQQETGEDPAEFFRQWLNETGIPEEFRRKYEQAPGSR